MHQTLSRASSLCSLCGGSCLGSQDACTADLLDLLLSQLAEELGLHNHGLVGQLTLTQDLEHTVLGHVDDGSNAGVLSGLDTLLRIHTKRQKDITQSSGVVLEVHFDRR